MTRRDMLKALGAGIFKITGLISNDEKYGKKVNLSNSYIITNLPNKHKITLMLQEEIMRRSGIKLTTAPLSHLNFISHNNIIILLYKEIEILGKQFIVKYQEQLNFIKNNKESYLIMVDYVHNNKNVLIIGNSHRSILFAIGHLLRLIEINRGYVSITIDDCIITKPCYPIRGHQLGYRDISNTYDAWDINHFEQYIRDLIVFGTNSIELTPAVDQNTPKNKLMPLPPWEMNIQLSKLLNEYDIDVWLWLPITDGDVSNPGEEKKVLDARRKLFESMERINAVFVPGGDPGDTPPQILLPFLEKMAKILHKFHPDAEVWVSHQGFEIDDRDWFYHYLQNSQPEWLTGVVYGPWTRDTLPNTRRKVPSRYRIRHYPDITHCIRCQYPVPEWDFAFAATLGREPINPCPRRYAYIHNLYAPYTDGFITYSDGVNDDVNKIVWSSLGWDPNKNVKQILIEYERYFISYELGEEIAEGLLALEANWRGPLLTNNQVEKTFNLWQSMADRAPELLKNWRFLQGLFRAYYDFYIQKRLKYEVSLEEKVYEQLKKAQQIGIDTAIKVALEILSQPPVIASEIRQRIEEIGEILFKSIGMQLSLRYGASGKERGAVLDSLDVPLNNRVWLREQLYEISSISDECEKLSLINTIVNWENPGEGSFYDDLGNPTKEPHLVRKPWASDPSFIESPQDEFSIGLDVGKTWRLSWHTQAQTLYETPLQMRYEGLDPNANYILRVIYTGRFKPVMRLIANGHYEIHGPIEAPDPPRILEFLIPKDIIKDGILELAWHRVGKVRGCQIAEVWLIKQVN